MGFSSVGQRSAHKSNEDASLDSLGLDHEGASSLKIGSGPSSRDEEELDERRTRRR